MKRYQELLPYIMSLGIAAVSILVHFCFDNYMSAFQLWYELLWGSMVTLFEV